MTRPITEVLGFLRKSEEDDVALITANAINLHLDALRRLHGRSRLEISDIYNLMALLSILLGERMTQPKRAPQVVEKLEEALREPS